MSDDNCAWGAGGCLLLIETSATGSGPAQGHADVTRQTVRKIHDLYFQLVAARPKVLVPELIHFLRLAGECLFPAGLLLIDGAALVRAQLVGKAKDLTLSLPILHTAFDDGHRPPDRLLLGNAGWLAELIDEGLFLRLCLCSRSHLLFRLFRLSQGNLLHHLLGGRQQCVGPGCNALAPCVSTWTEISYSCGGF